MTALLLAIIWRGASNRGLFGPTWQGLTSALALVLARRRGHHGGRGGHPVRRDHGRRSSRPDSYLGSYDGTRAAGRTVRGIEVVS